MDQTVYSSLVALMTITCNIIWSVFRYYRPSSLSFLPEQNSEIAESVTSPDGTTPKMFYPGARPKQKAAADALILQPK